jgi:hypothetical protein
MLQTSIVGSSSLNPSEVDANGRILVNPPTNPDQAGYALMAGMVPGMSAARQVMVSVEGRPHVSVDRPVFYMNFAGSATPANAIPQDVLKQTATTMTASAGSTAGGFLWLNSGAITTTATGIAYQTYATFPTFGGYGTRYEFEALTVNCNGAANKVLELGAGLIASATAAGLQDGFCFRWTSAGTFIGVICINGVEYQTSPLTAPPDGQLARFSIMIDQIGATFFINQVYVGQITAPAGTVGPTLQSNPPLLMRINNTVATPALAPQVKVAEVWVSQNGLDWQKPWPHIIAGMGQHAVNAPLGSVSQVAGGFSTNNRTGTAGGAAVPVAAVGTNTAATLPIPTSLGGIGRMTAQATNIAAAGEMVFCSYQVPVQSATQTSKRLVITGIAISASNGGAAVATTNTTLYWQLAWGHTALSLATSDAVNAKGPRFLPLGQMTVPVGAVVGGMYDRDIARTFATPIVVNPGEFVAVTVRFLVGTATASQEVVASIGFEGYWE